MNYTTPVKIITCIIVIFFWCCQNHTQLSAQQSVFSKPALTKNEVLSAGYNTTKYTIKKDTFLFAGWYRKRFGDTLINYHFTDDTLNSISIEFNLDKVDSAQLFTLLLSENFKRVNHFDKPGEYTFINNNGIAYETLLSKKHLQFFRYFTPVKRINISRDSVISGSSNQ